MFLQKKKKTFKLANNSYQTFKKVKVKSKLFETKPNLNLPKPNLTYHIFSHYCELGLGLGPIFCIG